MVGVIVVLSLIIILMGTYILYRKFKVEQCPICNADMESWRHKCEKCTRRDAFSEDRLRR